MYKVLKRDNTVTEFDITKISGALAKAFDAMERECDRNEIDFLALKVTADFDAKIKNDLIAVEDIQDSAEQVLIQAGYADVAKAYILYRREREKLRNLKSTILDYKETVNNYVRAKSLRMKENATASYSVGGLILSNSGAITANYWLSEIYDAEISAAHRSGDMHLHDLTMLTGYCAGWSLKQLIAEGLGGVMGKIDSKPPKHLYSLCNQMINFLGVMQNEWAGAQSFCSFDTYLAPFVKADALPYKEVKNCIETFVFGVNTPSRWGTQAPFSNITLDWTVPEDLFDEHPVIGGAEAEFTYGDCQPEMDIINRAFMEVMRDGDSNGSGLAYPIPTYAIDPDFDWSDTENNRLLFGMAAKYGTPYFANYISSGRSKTEVRDMLRPSYGPTELRRKAGGFFGCGENSGSIGAVTLNLPRLAYLSENEDEFYSRLDKLMDLASRSLEIKRSIINKLMNEGMYPYTKRYIGSFDNHFSTIGIVGMNEAGLNARWLRAGLTDVRTQRFAKDVLRHMLDRLRLYQERTGALYNLEATPAESTAYRLAREDAERYPAMVNASRGGAPYYTNSTHMPVDFTDDLTEALEAQDELQTMYTSGTVFHVYTQQELPDWQRAAEIVRAIATGYQLPYYTLTPTYTICPRCGYIAGARPVCPGCGEKTEVFSRITGYYRPIDNWNEGKLQEFKDRIPYRI
ncbi:MAG: ribonucleoside triphosphate reductase [Clostridia bacterium]|nr:ribonucleoside triphosphate reductase [Clostridia bacterium]